LPPKYAARRARILAVEETRTETKEIQDLSTPATPLIHPEKGKNDTKRKTKMKRVGRMNTQFLSPPFLEGTSFFDNRVCMGWRARKSQKKSRGLSTLL